MQVIEVVAAVISRGDGRVLACRRGPGRAAAGLWEFPGGKVERGEDQKDALAREIREELQADLLMGVLLTRNTTRVDDVHVDLACYRAVFSGDAPQESSDHDEMRWIAPTELRQLDWALPDVPAVELLTSDQSRP